MIIGSGLFARNFIPVFSQQNDLCLSAASNSGCNELFAQTQTGSNPDYTGLSYLLCLTLNQAATHFSIKFITTLLIDRSHPCKAVNHDFEICLDNLSDKRID